MKKTCLIALAVVFAALQLIAAEDWRGSNRISGVVLDKSTGKPVAKAKVMLRIQKGAKGGPDVITDANGKFAVLGMAGGSWNVDVEAPGYVTRQGSMSMAEGQKVPPMKIELDPQAAPAPTADASTPEVSKEEVKIGGQVVQKDIADAVEAGNAALGAKNYKDAISNYEKASAALPDFMPIKFALARAYYGDNQLKKAIAVMEAVYKADTTNAQNAMLYANMLLEDGQVERGKVIIDALPPAALNYDALLNMGISLINKKQNSAATGYFTKAISLDPNSHLGYYYRGLAAIQLNKLKEAKPDLDKVIALAPDSPEAKDAREYLKMIK